MEIFRDPIPELKQQVGRELARAMSAGTVADLSELLEIDAPGFWSSDAGDSRASHSRR